MKDMIGEEVTEGDYLIDDRGKLWQVQPTDVTYQIELLVMGRERRRDGVMTDSRILRLPHSLKASEAHLSASPQARRVAWANVYQTKVSPAKRIEISDRRRAFQERRR